MNPARPIAATAALLLAACGSIPERSPVPEELARRAGVPGIPGARYWGDEQPPLTRWWNALSKAEVTERFPGVIGTEHHYLAISGGGSNGAFGAGLLCGWTARGDRPEFTMVTGISTGALIAPFAFLGPEYDHVLEEVYTTVADADIFEPRSTLTAIQSDAFAETAGLTRLIARYVDEALVEKVAAESRKGRRLLVATTNLDAARPVHWNITQIAESGAPNALDLIRDVLRASASIPVAFPPVVIPVEVDGQRFDELHVDGGVTAQVFLYPLDLDWDIVEEKLEVPSRPKTYVIRNSPLAPPWKTVDPAGIGAIAAQTIGSLIRTQGIGDLYRIYLATQRDGLDFHLSHIPDDFDEPREGEFDPVYMRKLFDRGFAMAAGGYPWLLAPPGM